MENLITTNMNGSMSSRFRPYASKLAVMLVAIALMIFAWSNIFINVNANAATLEGIGSQIEGKVQKDIGTKERAVGDITDDYSMEAEGAMKQAKGEVKQGIGTTQNKLDDAKNAIEDESKSLIDSVKDFLN